jgi:hypothetical protein
VSERPKAIRRPPAYPRYAADWLARETFYRMSLAARGLASSIQDGCWLSEDLSVPADASELAVVIRRDPGEVVRLLPEVLHLFDVSTPGRLVDAHLRDYMAELMDRRRRQSEGGIKGNRTKWGKSSDTESGSESLTESVERSVLNTRQDKSNQSLGSDLPEEHRRFIEEIEANEPGFSRAAAAR